jgi:signal transduction histidine kinase
VNGIKSKIKAKIKAAPSYHNQKLWRRFVISIAIFVVFMLVLWLSYQRTIFAYISQAAEETIAQTESYLLTVLDGEFSDMKQTAALIAGSESVQTFLTEDDVLTRYAQADTIAEIIRTAAYPSFTEDNLLIVTADGSFFQFIGSVSSNGCDVIRDSILVDADTVYTVLELDNGRFFCLSNPVFRRVDGKSVPVGYVILLSNIAKTRRILTTLVPSGGIDTAVVLDGKILLSSNPELDGQSADSLEKRYGSVTIAQVTGSELYAATAITKDVLNYGEHLFLSVSLITLFVMMALIILLYRFMSAKMVSPMLASAEKMQMGLLKLQISAHFVVNTISAIKGLSEKGENEKAALAAEHLAGMLRNIHESDEESNIYDVVTNLRRFTEIMNIRHNDKFIIDMDMDDRLSNYKMPWQILQPLAENALTHGLLTKDGECILSVTGRIDGENVLFEVSDNGIGMENAQIKAMQDVIDRAVDWDYDEYRLKGVAIINIQKRIRSRYGGGYGLTLEGGPGAGLKVTVRLPLIRDAAE